MNNSMKTRLIQIKDEVRELHPLLETIFRKMPTIQKVDYTHGPNEKGADFVLTKISEELGDTEYIGVIVKVGKITQSIMSVDEQIEECSLRRITSNAKKEVFLSEIWVAVNGTISNNAKDKIYEKYQSKKVKFIDINRLCDLTEKYFPDYGIEISICDSKFLSREKELCVSRENKFNLLPKDAKESHLIQQDIVQVEEQFSQNQIKVDIFSIIEKSDFVSIESQMGGGKTKLLNRLVLHYTDPNVYKDKSIIPLYINSKDVLSRGITLREIVEERTIDFELNEKNDRVFLVIIDGLDELKTVGEKCSEQLLSLIEEAEAERDLKLVVASRSIADDKIEANETFRSNRYEIQPLKLGKMVKFLEDVCSGLDFKTRLIEDLKSSDLFKVLPKTPIAAIILAKLLSEGTEELPMNLTELYSKYCELALGRWDVEKGLKTQKQYEALDVIVSQIAKFMMVNELNCISIVEAKDIFNEYLSERNLNLNADDLFDDLLERSGVVVDDPFNKTISFKHRSFAEYFFAKSLQAEHNVEINAKVFSPYWSNSFFFFVGLKKDCPDLLEQIINLPIENEGQRFYRTISLGGFLLAGYQSPYTIIEKGIKSVFLDAGNHYTEIYSEQENSFFSKLPAMHLLSLFSNILNQGYMYKFFEEAILKIEEELATDPGQLFSDGKPYTLFFLDYIRYKLGSESLFENLLDMYGPNLPTTIQLAVGHVSKGLSYDSPAIKKTQKRIRKHARNSRSYRESIKKLYDQSIDGSYDLSDSGMKRTKKVTS